MAKLKNTRIINPPPSEKNEASQAGKKSVALPCGLRICLLTGATANLKWLYDITNPTKEHYASTHGHDFIFDVFKERRDCHVFFQKLDCILRHLADYDWILWTDTDASIVRNDFDLCGYINDNAERPFLAADDENGFNAGVMLVKNCDTNYRMLKSVFDNRERISDDQTGIRKYFETHDGIRQSIPGTVFNAHHIGFGKCPNPYKKEETFIIHIAGGTNSSRKHNASQVRRYFGIS